MVGLIWFIVGMLVSVGLLILMAEVYTAGTKKGMEESAKQNIPSDDISEVK